MEQTQVPAITRYCDIVMKGGITSGVVYPAAVCEIAKDFTFKNVGGTSAGAIAAAVTAAAERRRARDGSAAGFARVAAIPDYLAAEDHLYKLFVPNSETRALFRTIAGLFGRANFRPALVAKWCALVWAYPIAAVLGAVPGVCSLLAVLWRPRLDPLAVGGVILSAATILAGMTIAVAVALGLDMIRKLPRNAFGMVSGVDDANRASEDALCTWLTRELEATAGLEIGVTPLTFSMLWDAKRDPSAPGLIEKPDEPDVNLEMITTNATFGRPYAFPANLGFYFNPDELRRFFPDHVVAWMKARPRKPRDAEEASHFAAHAPKMLPLPAAGDLPVIVATRMSLAFPILLCAVPLHAADNSLAVANGAVRPLEPCWFSDGGISSNFPVTLFDSPLPRWPTFAIDLEPFPKNQSRSADETQNVHMPESNSEGILPTFSRFASVTGFLSAVADAMQNWNDNTQSRLPGYRDRIVTVYLDSDEGGLNLDMPPMVLARLRARGAAAGALAASRFKEPSLLKPGNGVMGWENHRWLRLRSALGAGKAYLTALARAAIHPEHPDVTYDALIAATDGTPAHHYPLTPGTNADVAGIADRLTQLGVDAADVPAIDHLLPKPSPILSLRSSLET